MRIIMLKLSNLLKQLDNVIFKLIGGKPQSNELCIATISPQINNNIEKIPEFSLKNLIGDGFLWAVPKHRRTIERRLKRRYGHPDYVWKLIVPKTNLRTCAQCGHDHEVATLCSHCYEKNREETEKIQAKIQEKIGLNPIEEDVIVLYDGEKQKDGLEFYEGKRIVEMKKPRPVWFSKNLIQKTTQTAAETKEIKPKELG